MIVLNGGRQMFHQVDDEARREMVLMALLATNAQELRKPSIFCAFVRIFVLWWIMAMARIGMKINFSSCEFIYIDWPAHGC